jgi:hypothetical protein
MAGSHNPLFPWRGGVPVLPVAAVNHVTCPACRSGRRTWCSTRCAGGEPAATRRPADEATATTTAAHGNPVGQHGNAAHGVSPPLIFPDGGRAGEHAPFPRRHAARRRINEGREAGPAAAVVETRSDTSPVDAASRLARYRQPRWIINARGDRLTEISGGATAQEAAFEVAARQRGLGAIG